MGFVLSVVREFVPGVGKTLPGSCAAVWRLQPERGDRDQAFGTVPVRGRGDRSRLWMLLSINPARSRMVSDPNSTGDPRLTTE